MNDERGGSSETLAARFLAALPDSFRATVSQVSGLEALLADLHRQGQRSWPGIDVDAAEFVTYLGERYEPGGGQPEAGLLSLRAADLYLACACSRTPRDEAAIAELLRVYGGDIDGVVRRLARDHDLVAEIRQTVICRLFLDEGGRIAQYSGAGELRGWLRMIAVRQALNYLRRVGKERPLEDDEMIELTSSAGNQELQYMKQLYRGAFRLAFRQALAALEVRERNLLRHAVLDGLTYEQIATIYNVHRSSVARWLAGSRQKLLEHTRAALIEQLNVDPAEFESIMRLIHSHLDLSLHSFLDSISSQ